MEDAEVKFPVSDRRVWILTFIFSGPLNSEFDPASQKKII